MALVPKKSRGVIGSFPAIPGFGGRFTEVADATHLEGSYVLHMHVRSHLYMCSP